MQNHARGDGGRGVLPITFLWAVFASSDDHISDVLCIGNISRRKQSDFAEWIKSGACVFLYWREFKAAVSNLASKAGSFGPILALDVINDNGFFPRQECWNDKPYALAGASGCKRQDVLGSVVTQIVKA